MKKLKHNQPKIITRKLSVDDNGEDRAIKTERSSSPDNSSVNLKKIKNENKIDSVEGNKRKRTNKKYETKLEENTSDGSSNIHSKTENISKKVPKTEISSSDDSDSEQKKRLLNKRSKGGSANPETKIAKIIVPKAEVSSSDDSDSEPKKRLLNKRSKGGSANPETKIAKIIVPKAEVSSSDDSDSEPKKRLLNKRSKGGSANPETKIAKIIVPKADVSSSDDSDSGPEKILPKKRSVNNIEDGGNSLHPKTENITKKAPKTEISRSVNDIKGGKHSPHSITKSIEKKVHKTKISSSDDSDSVAEKRLPKKRSANDSKGGSVNPETEIATIVVPKTELSSSDDSDSGPEKILPKKRYVNNIKDGGNSLHPKTESITIKVPKTESITKQALKTEISRSVNDIKVGKHSPHSKTKSIAKKVHKTKISSSDDSDSVAEKRLPKKRSANDSKDGSVNPETEIITKIVPKAELSSSDDSDSGPEDRFPRKRSGELDSDSDVDSKNRIFKDLSSKVRSEETQPVESITDEAFIEILAKTDIYPDWVVPQLHTMTKNLDRQLSENDKQTISKMNLTYREGGFTPAEDEILSRNWNQMCQKFNIPNCPEVFARWRNTTNKGKFLKARRRALVYLGKDLPHRTLSQIYGRIKTSIGCTQKGKFTENEKEVIEMFLSMKDNVDGLTQRFLSGIIGRDKQSTWRYLQQRQKEVRANVKWNLPLAEKFLKHLLKEANKENGRAESSLSLDVLRNKEITQDTWTSIGEKMNVHPSKLKDFWLRKMYEKNYSYWQDVKWKELVAEFDCVTTLFLWKIFYVLVRLHCPESLKDLKESVNFLYEKFVIKKVKTSSKRLRRLEFNQNGRLVFKD